MAADIRCIGWIVRQNLYLTDDNLLILEHELTSDRMRRFRYDQLEALILWRRLPWDRIVVTSVVLGVPVLVLLFIGEPATFVIAILLLIALAVMLARYFIFQRTYIRLTRGNQPYTCATISSPARVHRFRDRLLTHVQFVSPTAHEPA